MVIMGLDFMVLLTKPDLIFLFQLLHGISPAIIIERIERFRSFL